MFTMQITAIAARIANLIYIARLEDQIGRLDRSTSK
jgi:hypothetical protein